MALICQRCKQVHRKCTGHNKQGRPCRVAPIPGGTVCKRWHGGSAPQVAAKAAVRYEIQSWGLGDMADVQVDLPQLILRMIWKSWERQAEYERERDRLIGESESLRDALVGDSYGEGGKVGEYIRGFQRLLDEERDRGAGWAFKAAALGVHVKQIEELSKRLSKGQGDMIAEMIRPALTDPSVGMSPAQQSAFVAVLRAQLASAAAVMTIDARHRGRSSERPVRP